MRHLFFILLLLSTTFVSAQSEDTTESRLVYIVLKDGSSFRGTIVRQEDKQFILHTESAGDITIPFDQIDKMEDLSGKGKTIRMNEDVWFPATHPTRYLFSTNAIPIEKGTGYYQNTWIFLNGIHYGFTRHFSFGVGFETISTLLGTPIFYLAPKLSFPAGNNWHVGGGALLFGATFADVGLIGLGYGQVTYGNQDRNLSGGVGYGFVEGEFASRPFVNIAGSIRIRENISLMTDNWLIPVDGYYPLFSYGARFMSRRMAIDLGFWNNPGIASTFPIGLPWASIVLKFGK